MCPFSQDERNRTNRQQYQALIHLR